MGLKQRQIAGSCAIAQSTVHEYLKAAAHAGVSSTCSATTCKRFAPTC
jgi:hypothetical protein